MKATVARFYTAHQSRMAAHQRMAVMARASSAALAPTVDSPSAVVSSASAETSSGGLVPSTITIKTFFHVANLQSESSWADSVFDQCSSSVAGADAVLSR